VESAGRVLCIFAVNGKIRIAGHVFPIKREEEPAVLRELSHRKSLLKNAQKFWGFPNLMKKSF
jgi:hypothetical protein